MKGLFLFITFFGLNLFSGFPTPVELRDLTEFAVELSFKADSVFKTATELHNKGNKKTQEALNAIANLNTSSKYFLVSIDINRFNPEQTEKDFKVLQSNFFTALDLSGQFDFDNNTLKQFSSIARNYTKIEFYYRDTLIDKNEIKTRLKQVAKILNNHIDEAIIEARFQNKRSGDFNKRRAIDQLMFFKQTSAKFETTVSQETNRKIRQAYNNMQFDYTRVRQAILDAKFDFSFDMYVRNIEGDFYRIENLFRRLPR